MFVNNRTPHEVTLARSHYAGGLFVAALVTTSVLRLGSHGLSPWDGKRAPLPSDPPDQSRRALWAGASITASGTVLGHGAPHAAKVELRAGSVLRSLAVFGDRQWVKNGGNLIASRPAAWDSMPLSWERAYGGSVVVPAGPVGPNKLPFPGGKLDYPQNPTGRGFCVEEAQAEGTALPNIESPDSLIRAPLDRPTPAGFAPCPDLAGLRLPAQTGEGSGTDPAWALTAALRMAHSAPGALIFDSLSRDTEVEIKGLGRTTMCFRVPSCPLRVAIRKAKTVTEIGAVVRTVHVSADDSAVLVTYASAFSYERAPSWVDVSHA